MAEISAKSVPGYIPPKGTISRLRNLRALRRMNHDLFDGAWEQVLIACQHSQHLFQENVRHGAGTDVVGEGAGERIGKLLVKANLVSMALLLHADVVAGNPPRLSVPKEFTEQSAALDRMSRACLFDGLFHEAALDAGIEGAAPIRTDQGGEGETAGAFLVLDRNDETFPVGPRGPDKQPTVWERRWIIERPDPIDKRKTLRFLRVERHRAGLIEHEAYKADGSDVLVELETLERVPLATAIETGLPVPAERTETGLPTPLIVELASYRRRGEPPPAFTRKELDLIDVVAAAFSRLDRVHELHTDPMVRGTDSMIDENGRAKRTRGVIVDPEKVVEYIKKEFALTEMLAFLDRAMEWLLLQLSVAPALLSITLSGGNSPVSFESRSIQSTITLAKARRSLPYMRQPLERAWTSACILDSRIGLRGYEVAPVSVLIRPEMPKDLVQKSQEQGEMLRNGLTSRRRAVIEIHGPDVADDVLAEIEADRKEEAGLQATQSFGAVPGIGAA